MRRLHDRPALVCDDGRVGHLQQSLALCDALDLEYTQIQTHPHGLHAALSPRWLPGALNNLGQAFSDTVREHPPELLIGTGRRAALALRAGHRACGAATVQILDPGIASRHFTCLIAPEHDRVAGDNVIEVFGSLTMVSAHQLDQWKHSYSRPMDDERPLLAVMVGAPTSHAPWTPADLDAALADCGDYAQVICTSPRTPRPVKKWASSRPAGLTWTDPSDGPNPYRALLAHADGFLVTPDSVNMVCEALGTGRPVACPWLLARGKIRRFLEAARERDLIAERLRPDHRYTPLQEALRITPQVQDVLDGR